MSNEINSKIVFPKADKQESSNGWTLSYSFLEHVKERSEKHINDGQSLEAIEATLLAIEEMSKERAGEIELIANALNLEVINEQALMLEHYGSMSGSVKEEIIDPLIKEVETLRGLLLGHSEKKEIDI